MVLVALGGFVAARFFGRARDDADDDVQGDHAITRALFGAANLGTTDDADAWVAPGFTAYVNGHEMAAQDVEQGPRLMADILTYYGQNVDDSYWQLYDEVHQKVDRSHEQLALRFVASGGFGGEQRDIEVAAFLQVSDGLLAEMRWVTDLTVFNQLRTAIGLPALD